MHQTTARFDEETWQLLDAAARRAGVSKAQYVRDSTATRLGLSALLPELTAVRRDVDQIKLYLAGRRGGR